MEKEIRKVLGNSEEKVLNVGLLKYLLRVIAATLCCIQLTAQPSRAEDDSWKKKLDPALFALIIQLENQDLRLSTTAVSTIVNESEDILVLLHDETTGAEKSRDANYWNELSAAALERKEKIEDLGYSDAECFVTSPACLVKGVPATIQSLKPLADNNFVIQLASDEKHTIVEDSEIVSQAGNLDESLIDENVKDWNLKTTGVTLAHDLGFEGEGTLIVGLDTGVAPHDDLSPSFSGYYHNAGVVAESAAQFDYEFFGSHGTETMGAALRVAPEAKWGAIKICTIDSCDSSAILRAGDILAGWVVEHQLERVLVNNSWSSKPGSVFNLYFDPVLENWKSLGVLPVFSVGNSGPECGTAGYPASSIENPLSVGWQDQFGRVASMSSRGDERTYSENLLIAPGSDIYVPTVADSPTEVLAQMESLGWHTLKKGTSFAAPQVTGVAAIIWSINPELSAVDVADLIKGSANQVDAKECGVWEDGTRNNTAGHGALNVISILRELEKISSIYLPTISK